jgi:hypothetical protein
VPLTSSQGNAYGISGATKVTIKKTRASSASDNKLDASTLSLAHGSDRVYEDGLADNGPNGSANGGVIVTAAVEFLGSGPEAGDTATFGGVECKCIDSEITNEAGALVKGVANFTSDYSE